MTQVEIIKFIVDGTLLAAVGYLAITFGRSQLSGGQAARELRTVEESMRRLIRDADEASRELNDQLLRREQGLKRTLSDIDNAEKRVRELVSKIESKDIELRSRIEVVRELAQSQLSNRETEPIPTRTRAAAQRDVERIAEVEVEHTIEPGSAISQSQAASGKHWTEIEDEDDFGLKVEKEVRPTLRSSGLAGAIERQHVSSDEIEKSEVKVPIGATLQDIIKAAHRMIQDGAELQAVASRTRLPLEQVRLLARAFKSRDTHPQREVEANAIASSASREAADSRLGVLRSMKREVHQV